PPAEYRNHDADQRGDRTNDGPGGGVAHRATAKDAESLERPDQTEQRDDYPDRERNDESPSHTRMLRPRILRRRARGVARPWEPRRNRPARPPSGRVAVHPR